MGLSALNYQHKFFSKEVTSNSVSDTCNVAITASDDKLLVEEIKKIKNIFGFDPDWEKYTDSNNVFHCKIMRPGRDYTLYLNKNTGQLITITESKGFGSIFVGMHEGIIRKPESLIFNIWGYYVLVASITAILLVFTGIYFWFKKSIKTKRDAYLAIGFGLGYILIFGLLLLF
ncbi:MAG: hypothetical protein SFY32_01410 [Bacteroidota bacterium]|nr:hypothetical protein [Bacteroidota bacterium]